MSIDVYLTDVDITIRRDTEANRGSVLLKDGELFITTDERKLYIGDGVTLGGVRISANVTSPSDIPAGVDAAKIANGQVSNTEYQYLDGVTSSIQTQINNIKDGTTDFTKIDVDNITIDANKISATNTNGSVELEANGTGLIDLKSPATTSNKAELNSLISKTKGEILDCILGLSAQDDFSDIRLCHIFDNTSGTSMIDKLGTGNNLTLSSASSSSTAGVIGTTPYDTTFKGGRYWQAADSNSLSFGDGSNDSDFSIIVAGIPINFDTSENVLLGKWDTVTGMEYLFSVGYNAQRLSIIKGDTSASGGLRKITNSAMVADIGGYHVYGATCTGTVNTGMQLYRDGVLLTDTSYVSFGSYTAMENNSCSVSSFYEINGVIQTGSIPNFRYSLILIIAKKLSSREVKKLSSILLGAAGSL